MERYRLMQSSALAAYPYSAHPALMAHPGLSPYLAQQRYSAEMLAQLRRNDDGVIARPDRIVTHVGANFGGEPAPSQKSLEIILPW